MPLSSVTEDGSPRASMTFALWEPPLVVDHQGQPSRVSTITETGDLLAGCVQADVQTVAFARSRAGVEVVANVARGRLGESPDEGLFGGPRWRSPRVSAYRGGYLPEERRELERALRSRDLRRPRRDERPRARRRRHWPRRGPARGLAGHAGIAVAAGRTGGAGRAALAGRARRCRRPARHVRRPPPRGDLRPGRRGAVVDPDNPHVLGPHLAAAAAELPLTEARTSSSSARRRGRCSMRSSPRASSRSGPAAGSGAARTGPPTTSRCAARASRCASSRRGPGASSAPSTRPRPTPRSTPAPCTCIRDRRWVVTELDLDEPRGLRRARRPGVDDAGAVGERLRRSWPRDRARATGGRSAAPSAT